MIAVHACAIGKRPHAGSIMRSPLVILSRTESLEAEQPSRFRSDSTDLCAQTLGYLIGKNAMIIAMVCGATIRTWDAFP